MIATTVVLVLMQLPFATYPILPPGMRVLVGGSGVYARNTPDANGTCGTPAHACTAADLVAPGMYGVVQADAPVIDPAGWSWLRVQYETGVTGWSPGYPPSLNMLNPPQMVQGSSFRVVGDYSGPSLTGATCINDGVNSAAVLSLTPIPGGTGQQGTLQCDWKAPPVGNHKAVITATNAIGSAPSTEFQFAVTTQAQPTPPAAPTSLRIGPVSGVTRTGGTADTPGRPVVKE